MDDSVGGAPTSAESAWRRYPFDLVPGDPEFSFPAAEAAHEHYQSDTWFIAGDLTAPKTGRRFAFLTIFNKNRPGGSVVADFYTLALFDIDNGTYGTFTDYDMPPKSMAPGAVPKLTAVTGRMDMTYDSGAGTAEWRSRRDADGQLLAHTYDLVLLGSDHDGAAMELRLAVSPTRPPVPVGAAAYNGRFACFGQPETFSYFQTGLQMTGTLRWADIDEEVSGTSGHIDRQWFPLPAGGGGSGGDQRAISHEWRTIHLDNGVDFVGWRQFDRRADNAALPFTGATVVYPDGEAQCVEDVDVHTTSYVRWPETVRQLIRPPSVGRYLPDRHTLRSATLDLELTGEPLVAAPAHALPIEYMEGPFLFRGTMAGKPVRGFGISERSIAMYRDWELVDVLATTIDNHEAAGDRLAPLMAKLATMIIDGQRQEARDYLDATFRPAIERLSTDAAAELGQIADDLAKALV